MKVITDQEKRQRVHLQRYDNSWYQPGSRLKITLWLLVNVLFFNNGIAVFNSLKCALLRLFGARVGKGVLIKPSVNIKYPWLLSIGDHVWIGEKTWIDNLAPVTIGDDVCISQGALLLTGNHNYKKAAFDLMIAPITLRNGVWIGARATVCPGVTCHSHSVLSMASVATADLEPYTIYQGLPAVAIYTRIIN